MKDVYLISENSVRQKTNISSNIDSKFLLTAIKQSQLEYELLIGTSLYNKLLNLVDNDSITDIENKNYKELLDKSQYYLAYTTLAKVIPLCAYHIDNFGITKQSDEHVEALTTSEMFKMTDYYTHEADTLKNRIQKYLIANYKEFEELSSSKIDEFKAELRSSASTSIFLGGARQRSLTSYKPLRVKYEHKF